MSKLKILSTKQLPEYSEEFLPFFLGNTEKEAEENYNKFSKLLNKISFAYARFSSLEKEDLFGTALTGLARALRDFDSNRNSNFLMYAHYRIRSVLNEYCHNNMSIVSIPSYVVIAHGYINRIRNILFKYLGTDFDVKDLILKRELREIEMEEEDKTKCYVTFSSLDKLSKNNKVKLEVLLDRANYVPTNVSFEETYLTEEDCEARDSRQIQITALISRMRDHMTAVEQSIADGILLGKTYDEIGGEQTPPRSSAWVRKQLNNLKQRLIKVSTK